MAEEEAGFTFVDKRAAVVTDAEEPAESGQETPQEDAFAAEAEPADASRAEAESQPEGAQGTPNVWVLLHYSLQLFAQHAWVSLGLVADPATGQSRADLAEARVAIDTVSDLASRLESAPADVIPSNARRDLRNLVNDLRLNYVNQKQAASPAGNAA
jgi:hypothetical protein